MKETSPRSFEPRRTADVSEDQRLTWQSLDELYEGLPDTFCAKSDMIMDLYDEGFCVELVEREVHAHMERCDSCQSRLSSLRETSLFFEHRRSNELSISDDDVNASFARFMSQYPEVILSSDIKEEKEDAPLVRPTFEVEGPHELSARAKKRIRGGIGLIFAAAMLFAYGPALIEAPIEEETYPSVDAQGGVMATHTETDSLSKFPLSDLLKGQKLTTSTAELKMTEIKPLTVDETTIIGLYTIEIENDKLNIEMTQLKLTPSQVASFKSRLGDSKNTEILKVTTERGQIVNYKANLQAQGDVQILEYVTDENHVQWAMSGASSISVLNALGSAHISELNLLK